MNAMVGLSRVASASPVLSQDQGGRETQVAKPAINCGKPLDLLAIKRVLPGRWMAFLRAHFRSAYDVHLNFSVTENTALNWWNGKCAPHASVALAVAEEIPSAVPFLIGKAA